MRRTLLAGSLLLTAAVLTMLASSALDLEVESTALLGLSTGAVLALVTDDVASRRLLGLGAGIAVSGIAYLVRAGFTPDTAGGRSAYVAVAVAGCVAVAVLSMGRLTLWSVLLGAGVFAGAFESTYTAAPPRVVDNLPGGITTLVLCVAIGFFAGSVAGPTLETDTPAEPTVEDDAGAGTLEETK